MKTKTGGETRPLGSQQVHRVASTWIDATQNHGKGRTRYLAIGTVVDPLCENRSALIRFRATMTTVAVVATAARLGSAGVRFRSEAVINARGVNAHFSQRSKVGRGGEPGSRKSRPRQFTSTRATITTSCRRRRRSPRRASTSRSRVLGVSVVAIVARVLLDRLSRGTRGWKHRSLVLQILRLATAREAEKN